MEPWRGRRVLVAALLSPPTVTINKCGRTQATIGPKEQTKKSSTSPKFNNNSICALCHFKEDDDEGLEVVPMLIMETLRAMMTQVGLDFGEEGDLIFCPFCSSQLLHLVTLKREINALGERLASMIIGLRSLLSSHPKSNDLDLCDEEEMSFEEELSDFKPDLMETSSQEEEEDEGATMTDDDLEGSSTDSPLPPPSPNVYCLPILHEDGTGEEEDDDVTLSPKEGHLNRPTPAAAADNREAMDLITPPSLSTDKTTSPNQGSDEGETCRSIQDSTKHMKRKGPTVKRSLCPACGKTYPSSAPCGRHLLTHPVVKSHSCRFCHRSFANPKCLTLHLKTHMPGGNVKRFACPKCQKTFRTRADLRQHSFSHGGANKPFVCQICGRAVIRPCLLKSHALMHTRNQPHVCPICPSTFRQKGHLQRHIAMAHPGQVDDKAPTSHTSRFVKKNHITRTGGSSGKLNSVTGTTKETSTIQCHLCGKVYRTNYGYRKHWKSVHEETFVPGRQRKQIPGESTFPQAEYDKAITHTNEGEALYTCQTCGKVFTWKKAFRIHMRGVHWKQEVCQCQVCGKVFQSKMGLWFHSKVCPPGQVDNDTRCRVRSCGLIFDSVEERVAHQREVHSIKIKIRAQKQARTSVKCYFCHKWTQSYPAHLRVHTLERPFDCSVCGMDFQQASGWRKHMSNGCRKGGILRTLQCKICHRCYTNPEAFEAHTHPDKTDAKRIQYGCGTCGSVFGDSAGFLKHIRIVHRKGVRDKSCPDYRKRNRATKSCYFCHKVLLSSNLVRHMPTHTLERPYLSSKGRKELASHT